MSYLGDFQGTETALVCYFSTVQSTGAPTTLSGTPKCRAYKAGSTTESSDITPTVDFDSRTGLNLVSIDLTGDTGFYAVQNDYHIVITAGTVNSVSVVGYVVGSFSVRNRGATVNALGPIASATTLTARDIGASVLLSNGTGTGQLKLASGYVAMTWADIAAPTTTVAFTGTTIAVTQKVDVDTIKTNPVVNAGTITFPTTATLASTTNVTGGTITTVTNLTNAPTNGDFTATMKTSIGTAVAASAVASVTGSVGSVVGLTASNLDTTISSRMASYTQPAGFLAATFGATVGTSTFDPTTAMTESYAADGATMSLAQALYEIRGLMSEFAISGTTLTMKKKDGTTTAATYTLDSATAPTAITRAT